MSGSSRGHRPPRLRRAAAMLTLAGLTAVTGVTGAADPAAGQPTPAVGENLGFQVGEVAVDRPVVTISGMDRTAVGITVRGGFLEPTADTDLVLTVSGARDQSGWANDYRPLLRLSSGTATEGTWTGSLVLPAAAAGTLTISQLYPGSCLTDTMSPTMSPCTGIPLSGPRIEVIGRHVPVVTARVRPRPLAVSARRYEVIGRLLDSETGRPPTASVTVGLAFDVQCGQATMSGARWLTTPDAQGRFRFLVTGSYPAAAANGSSGVFAKMQSHCVLVAPGPPSRSGVVVQRGWANPILKATMTAQPARRWAAAGASVRVLGRSQDNLDVVELQRLVGRSSWRTVAIGPVRYNGRITLAAPLPHRGVFVFRTHQARSPGLLATTSAVFAVRAR